MIRILNLLMICAVFMLFSCGTESDDSSVTAEDVFQSSSYEEDGLEGPQFAFEKEEHSFGEIERGDSKSHKFKFENSGDARLIISDVKAGCGCTVASYTERPLEPGDEGFIEVEYDSEGRSPGHFYQNVTIFSNASTSRYQITVSGQIIES